MIQTPIRCLLLPVPKLLWLWVFLVDWILILLQIQYPLLKAKVLSSFEPVAEELPGRGFVADPQAYLAPKGKDVEVKVSPDSDRLQILAPFHAWDGKDMQSLKTSL